MKLEEDDGEQYLADEEDGDDGGDVEQGEAEWDSACERGEEGFRDLVDAGGTAAGGQAETSLGKAGDKIAGHGECADEEANCPGDAENHCAGGGDDGRREDAAQSFG